MFNPGFDLDGVIANTHTILREAFILKYNHDIDKGLNEYKIKIPGVSSDEIVFEIRQAICDYIDITFPYPTVVEILLEIYEIIKKPIPIITARSEKIYDHTQYWCKKNLKCPVNITCCGESGTSLTKNDIIIKREFDIWVDDRFKIANEIAPFVTRSFLINRIYNMGRKEAINVQRIDDLLPVLQFIKRNTKG